MLHLGHRVTISIKSRPVKLEQAVSERLPHKSLVWDPVPSSIRARNAQEINITNCDVTTWSWVPGELGEPPLPARERKIERNGESLVKFIM